MHHHPCSATVGCKLTRSLDPVETMFCMLRDRHGCDVSSVLHEPGRMGRLSAYQQPTATCVPRAPRLRDYPNQGKNIGDLEHPSKRNNSSALLRVELSASEVRSRWCAAPERPRFMRLNTSYLLHGIVSPSVISNCLQLSDLFTRERYSQY